MGGLPMEIKLGSKITALLDALSSPFCISVRYYGKVFCSFAGNAQKRKKQLV